MGRPQVVAVPRAAALRPGEPAEIRQVVLLTVAEPVEQRQTAAPQTEQVHPVDLQVALLAVRPRAQDRQVEEGPTEGTPVEEAPAVQQVVHPPRARLPAVERQVAVQLRPEERLLVEVVPQVALPPLVRPPAVGQRTVVRHRVVPPQERVQQAVQPEELPRAAAELTGHCQAVEAAPPADRPPLVQQVVSVRRVAVRVARRVVHLPQARRPDLDRRVAEAPMQA